MLQQIQSTIQNPIQNILVLLIVYDCCIHEDHEAEFSMIVVLIILSQSEFMSQVSLHFMLRPVVMNF